MFVRLVQFCVLLLPACVLGEEHWAFQPLKPSQAAGVDAFIHQQLAAKNLQPSPAADRRTLLRRATFDLTGLPPSPAEVEAFVDDASPDAYAKCIDRLLASPHYGEHWARHWLDVARYSDTKGYVYAREEKRWAHAWAYRDWVVGALNSDMPYNRFVRLQIAADQIAPAGSPDLAAMGFLTLGRRFLGVTHDIIDDRIDVVTRGMLGLTAACARCHDHKYDPIPISDYYALYGVFQSSAEKLVPCGVSHDAAFLTELHKREQKLRDTMTLRREEQSARVRATIKEHLLAQLELDKYPEEVFGQIIEAKDLNPFIVRRWQAYLAQDRQNPDPVFAEWHKLSDQKAMDKLRESAAHYDAIFAGIETRWRELIKTDPNAATFPDARDERLCRVLHGIDSPCHVPDEHIANNEMYFPTSVITELWKLQGEVDRWLLESANAAPHATILVDRPIASTPRVFNRGNPLTKGDEVPRRFLQVLAGAKVKPFAKGSGRLELADAIADPANPLTARVMVNRAWMHHFGRGLVSTPSDFGRRTVSPSHPELLDWLAHRFIQSGWSLKELHRVIMLSQTYQQNSRGPADPSALAKAQQIDPENRLLWRMTAHRLTFEEARDAWLSASGELNRRGGGKPDDLFGKQNTRRTLYALVDREKVPAILRTFDFANPDLSIPQRDETTVPQQALFGMNHPFIAGRAAALAHAIKRSRHPDDSTRIRQLYSSLYQRGPTDDELEQALAFVQPAQAPAAPPSPPSPWTYGYGEFDTSTGRIKNFTSLPHFNGTAWQGGDEWPDSKLGWLQLTATGGHPGNDRKHAIVRRWTAPHEGSYMLSSTLKHEPKAGDGIRAFVSHGVRGLLRSASLHHATEQIDLAAITMNKGGTLDFVVDIRDGLNSDQFLWSPTITLAGSAGSGGDTVDQAWSAEHEFAGGTTTHLDPWQQLTQVLMLSNEFMFVD